MIFTAIDHPAIACFDTKKQIDWYCKTLGMQLVASTPGDPPSAIVGYDDNASGGAVIELMPVRDVGDKPAYIPRFSPGLRHVALRVSSFDKAYAQLKAAGVEFIGEAGVALGGGRIQSFRDPEGNELQIVERPAGKK